MCPREGLNRAIRVLLSSFLVLWQAASPAGGQERIAIKVLGQPLAAGWIAERIERPFFASLGQRPDLPLGVDYVPMGDGGFAESDAFGALQGGQAQIAVLRISQVGRRVPIFLGLDLVGLNIDYHVGRRVIDSYGPVLDARLQESTGVKLLGAWPYEQEVLFCAKPIKTLSDVRGLKIRVYDSDSAAVIERAGAVPVALAFGSTRQSIATHAVDCALGNPTAALAAGWAEATTSVLPLAFQLGINAYGISLPAWRRLDGSQQAALTAAFQSLTNEIWRASEQLSNDAIGCSTGKSACTNGLPGKLTYLPVSAADIGFLQEVLRDVSFPRWAQLCDRSDPACSQHWKEALRSIIPMP
jgi:TRAP-type C4-dicarboxylate transport system substrate-binding protein